VRPHLPIGAGLVEAHEPAVVGRVRNEDRGQAAFGVTTRHVTSARRRQLGRGELRECPFGRTLTFYLSTCPIYLSRSLGTFATVRDTVDSVRLYDRYMLLFGFAPH
jgi:hypothetical protein